MAVPTAKEIMDFSPFNQGGKEKTPEFKRSLYSELERTARKKYMVAISGMRRVGKTTLLKQILIKHGGAYFSFDEPRYQNVQSLDFVIETLRERGFSTMVLDEIGNVQDWGGTLKKHYDKGEIKFYISGSSSLGIKKGNESLAGRMLEYALPPFQFDEYLRLNGISQKEKLWQTRQFPQEVGAFLKTGSFPEIHKESETEARKYITTLADKVVFEDIPLRYGIEHRGKLEQLLKYCASFSAAMFSEASVANTLGISRGTVSDYLSYLQQSYMASLVLEQGSYARALQKARKTFVSCPSLYWALSDSFSEGTCAEVAVFDRLLAWGKKPFFYRDYQKREVDFIVGNVPVEVKCQTYISEGDYSSLLYYLKAKKRHFGIIVTKETFDEKKIDQNRILLVPLSVFLSLKNFEELVLKEL